MTQHDTTVSQLGRLASSANTSPVIFLFLFFLEKESVKLPNLANWLTLGMKSVRTVSQLVLK
jgi:hypothetical protein